MRRRALGAAFASALLPAGCAAATTSGSAIATPFALPAGFGATGGLELDRAMIGFGGLSGLHLAPDLRLTAVSDLGHWMSARLVLDGMRPVGLADLRRGPLRDGAGRPLRRREGDAECLARLPDGTWLVGFERWHRIRAYRTLDGPGGYIQAPPGLDAAPDNQGLESLTVLADGRWFAIAEDLPARTPGTTTAWLGGPGRWMALAWRPAPDFVPVDAVGLPDGGALVLERRFTIFGGFEARLTRVPAPALAAARPDTVLQGEVLFSTSDALPRENWEGVSAIRHNGALLVTLVTDDNERSFQRGLIAVFALEG
ncbi:esterase-like activity of phytase family protein [Roseomonas hellenica]|uniref:Esterase-like activity of phytase family protein n=1 Tax=Plastoroseomonas hellenica TaxID=2687306 RepID=A0ABS5F188_9PROT|nr:esterase-like activity of phytase family protein [Plastoroseomonas hellenica]